MIIGVIYFFVAIGSMLRPRWLPQKSLPPYAYLPGKNPHPVRDPAGHSYHVEPISVAAEVSLSSDAFLWGLDLFNHGTGKLMRPGKVFGRLRIETARCACSSRA